MFVCLSLFLSPCLSSYLSLHLSACLSVCLSRRLSVPMSAVEHHDALYVVGSLDETLELRGMRYHPIDIGTSVIASVTQSIAEW